MKTGTLDTTAHGDIPRALLDQAIDWAVRLGSGSADPRLHDACETWRAAHPSHEQAWQRVQAVEDAFRQVPPMDTALASDALHATSRARSKGRRHAIGLLGLAATGGVLGLLAWREQPWLQRADYATGIGERRRVVLADGTELHLDTRSEAQVLFSPLRRLIVLRHGELFVRTGADGNAMFGRRTFWVHASNARFEAIGTRFGIREEGGETRLAMTEGRVAIHAGDAPPMVAQAGDGYVIRAGAARPQRTIDRSFEPGAWADGALVAKQMRLDAFVAELARYREAPLRCDPEIAALRVSGVFQLSGPDPVGRALEALVRTLPVRLERGAGDALTVSKR